MRKFVAPVFGLLLIPILSFAYTNPGQSTGFVNDFAQILSVQDKSFLENKLSALEKSTGDEVSIVIIKSLDGDTIENFAVKLFADWGIGKKDKNNGALILVSVDDREMRMEVGYGLESTLTDITTSRIINEIITPEFKKGNYALGLGLGADQITNLLNGGALPPPQTLNFSLFSRLWIYIPFFIIYLISILGRSKSWWMGGVLGGIISIILVFVSSLTVGIIAGIVLIPFGLLLDYLVSKQYEKHKLSGTNPPWWIGGGRGGGGGFGGGFGGFGGGMSGGGGSSGKW